MTDREKAIEFATKAHEGQTRKFNNEPYINHPIRVANWIDKQANLDGATQKATDLAYISAILHDVLEDTDVTKGLIISEFGIEVAEIVDMLTRTDETYFEFILSITRDPSSLGSIARVVKVGDIEDNMSDLQEGSLKDKYRFARHLLLTT